MFLGWYDPDRKKPARAKLAEAIDRYEEKFGRAPQFCLTSPQDVVELNDDPKAKAALPDGFMVHPRGYIARWTFYIGEEGVEKLTPVDAEEALA